MVPVRVEAMFNEGQSAGNCLFTAALSFGEWSCPSSKCYSVEVTSSSDPDGAADLTKSGYLFYYLAATVAFAQQASPTAWDVRIYEYHSELPAPGQRRYVPDLGDEIIWR